MAQKAAMTGHQVYTTLHTNDSFGAIPRLLDLGLKPGMISGAIISIFAQRLARRLCSNCKVPTDIPDKILEEEGMLDINIPKEEFELYKPVGCDKCTDGYKGRVGVYEVVRITPEISRIIMEGGNSIQIADAAKRAGFNDLRISALRKAAQGLTSLEEANRVTKD